MNKFSLGAKSMGKLDGVHPDLVRVVSRSVELTSQDFSVIDVVRTVKRQHELYGHGRTPDELWVSIRHGADLDMDGRSSWLSKGRLLNLRNGLQRSEVGG